MGKCQFLLDRFGEELSSLGYVITELDFAKVVVKPKSSPAASYPLVFASKHGLGGHLWNQIGLIEPGGQRVFDFESHEEPEHYGKTE